MTRIRMMRVGFAHAGASTLFSDLDLTLRPPWTALAGPNGSGKSTLLALLAGVLAPRAGRVRLEPADARVVLSHQDPVTCPDLARHLAEDWSGEAHTCLARFALDRDMLARWPTLSPGERQRWQIAGALHAEPDVLLLDEPTNHLDTAAQALLLAALRTFRGVGLVVAHDRDFLDGLVSRTAWLEAGGIRVYEGGYSDARRAMEGEARKRAHERREQKKRLARAEAELARTRRALSGAEAQISARRRMKGPRDSDGRSVNRRARAESGAKAHASGAARRTRKVVEAEARLDMLRTTRAAGGAVRLRAAHAPKSRLLHLEARGVTVHRSDRIRVAGPNGSGKSTLLKALASAFTLPADRLIHLPQELFPDTFEAARRRIGDLSPKDRGHTLSILASLGVDPRVPLHTPRPSPGEAKKLVLAEALGRQVVCAMLDEPENHLDIPSIERLEAALMAFDGALILVTHDGGLARATTDVTWDVAVGSDLTTRRPPGMYG